MPKGLSFLPLKGSSINILVLNSVLKLKAQVLQSVPEQLTSNTYDVFMEHFSVAQVMKLNSLLIYVPNNNPFRI